MGLRPSDVPISPQTRERTRARSAGSSDRLLVAEQRLSFGADAELYDRARPSYPAQLADDILQLVGARCCAVDVGCGTAKATVLFAERGVRGVGVEPDAAMAAIARAKLEPFAGWRVDLSDFEEWTPEASDPPVDLIIAAESWHWVSRRRGPLLAHQLLRPGGWLAVFAYEANRPDTPLRRGIDAAYAKYAPGPGGSDMAKARPWSAAGASFGEPVRFEYPSFADYSADEWIANLRTSSNHRMLPPEQSQPLEREVAAAINAFGGTYRHHTVCKLWAVQRR